MMRTCNLPRFLCGTFLVDPGRAQFPFRRFSTHQQHRKVIVVRHGETDWNKALRVQGSTDIPLNEKGTAQAKASAEAIAKVLKQYKDKPKVIYSSPLARAKDTAVAIAETISESQQPAVEVSTTNALKEWNLGVLEGLTKDKAIQDHPEDWRIFSQWANPHTSMEDAEIPLSQGESMEQVRWRVVNGINAMKTDDVEQQPLICVTHGGVLGQLLRHVVQTQPENTPASINYSRPGNACISEFVVLDIPNGKEASNPQWTIERWADTSHLTGELAPIAADYDQKGKQT